MTMTAKKQTAVMWLIEQYEQNKKKGSLYGFKMTKKIQKQALQMEREQIEEAHIKGGRRAKWSHEEFIEASNQYYTDTYGE